LSIRIGWGRNNAGRRKIDRGKLSSPLFRKLHLFDLDALIRAHFNAAHAPNTLSCLVRVGLAVCAHLINLYRADVDAFAATSAAIHVDVDQIHCNLLNIN
jgi:hypothetical protein